VIAPVPASDGRVLARLSGRYSLVAHPYIAGGTAGEDGEFARAGDRGAALDLLVRLHRARVGAPRADDFVVPHPDVLPQLMREPREAWRGGPYARRAWGLLHAHAAGLDGLMSAYASLAGRVAQRQDRLVITHGEPHAGNVVVASGGLVLVDRDTVLLAPPERDLWSIADDDKSALDHYARAAGAQIDQDALSLRRLWFDLAEIGGYLTLLRAPHDDTADAAESWGSLQRSLRPAERWPALLNPARTAQDPETAI
jgi:spectinomycin phosphotransferase